MCGATHTRRHSYCPKCLAAYQRMHRPSYYELHPEELEKQKCRLQTWNLIRTKKVTREPCKICRAPRTQAHHPDYNDHTLIEWYCADHHRVMHKVMQESAKVGTKRPAEVEIRRPPAPEDFDDDDDL